MSVVKLIKWGDNTIKFSSFKKIEDTDDISKLTNKTGVKAMYWEYSGMGHSSIIFYFKDKYQCLLLGGSNGYDAVYTDAMFYLYNFDQQIDQNMISGLKPDTDVDVYRLEPTELFRHFIGSGGLTKLMNAAEQNNLRTYVENLIK